MKNEEFKHDNDYSVSVYKKNPDRGPGNKFKDDRIGFMKYVHDMRYFIETYLVKQKTDWDYLNIEARRTGRFITRIYRGDPYDRFPK